MPGCGTYPRGDDLGDAEGTSLGHLVLGLVPEGLGGVGRADVVVGGVDGRLAVKVYALALEVVGGLVDGLRLALEGGRRRGVGEVCGKCWCCYSRIHSVWFIRATL